MILYYNDRLACAQCIKGHRSSTCKHIDKDLISINNRGRPNNKTGNIRFFFPVGVKFCAITWEPIYTIKKENGHPVKRMTKFEKCLHVEPTSPFKCVQVCSGGKMEIEDDCLEVEDIMFHTMTLGVIDHSKNPEVIKWHNEVTTKSAMMGVRPAVRHFKCVEEDITYYALAPSSLSGAVPPFTVTPDDCTPHFKRCLASINADATRLCRQAQHKRTFVPVLSDDLSDWSENPLLIPPPEEAEEAKQKSTPKTSSAKTITSSARKKQKQSNVAVEISGTVEAHIHGTLVAGHGNGSYKFVTVDATTPVPVPVPVQQTGAQYSLIGQSVAHQQSVYQHNAPAQIDMGRNGVQHIDFHQREFQYSGFQQNGYQQNGYYQNGYQQNNYQYGYQQNHHNEFGQAVFFPNELPESPFLPYQQYQSYQPQQYQQYALSVDTTGIEPSKVQPDTTGIEPSKVQPVSPSVRSASESEAQTPLPNSLAGSVLDVAATSEQQNKSFDQFPNIHAENVPSSPLPTQQYNVNHDSPFNSNVQAPKSNYFDWFDQFDAFKHIPSDDFSTIAYGPPSSSAPYATRADGSITRPSSNSSRPTSKSGPAAGQAQ